MSQYKNISQRYHQETRAILTQNNNELLRELLERAEVQDLNGQTILDFGCGTGLHLGFLLKEFPRLKMAYGIDQEEALLGIARREIEDPRLKLIHCDFVQVPIADGSIDFLFARYAVHYSEDLNATLREVSRLLRVGGRAFIQDAHPFFTMFLKGNKDYEQKEQVHFPIQGGETVVTHPSFTIDEYFQAIEETHLRVVKYRETFGGRSLLENGWRIPTTHYFVLQKIV